MAFLNRQTQTNSRWERQGNWLDTNPTPPTHFIHQSRGNAPLSDLLNPHKSANPSGVKLDEIYIISNNSGSDVYGTKI